MIQTCMLSFVIAFIFVQEIMRNDVAHRVLPAIFIGLCQTWLLSHAMNRLLDSSGSEILCGHLLPYGMNLVLEMLRVFWSCCHVFSCGLLHCLALDTESLLEQANLYMKEMPLSDLNSALEPVVCYGVNCSTCWMILFSTDGNMKYVTIHWYMN